jgi:hypothetical protein
MAILDAPTLIVGAGFTAARIRPVNYTPQDGLWCFCVGSDVAGVFDNVETGDAAGVYQTVDLASINLLTFACAMRNTEGIWTAKRRGFGVTYPTGFAGGETLQIKIDGGSPQVITFVVSDQSLSEVVDRVNATLTGGTAVNDNNQLRIDSDGTTQSTSVGITGGTGMATLGHSIGTTSGDRVSFKMKVFLDLDLVYEWEPAVDTTVTFVKRTINTKRYLGDVVLKCIVEAIS